MNADDIMKYAHSCFLRSLPASGCSFPQLYDIKLKSYGNSNYCLYTDESIFLTLSINFLNGASDNILILGNKCKINGTHNFTGKKNLSVIGDNTDARQLGVHVDGEDLIVVIGADVTIIGVLIFCAGKHNKVSIGDDCLLSYGIAIRNNDDHGIFDLESLKHINVPKDIFIQPHVWICPNCTILKDTVIGLGSVIATNTISTGEIPPFTLAGGIPAKVLRNNICWDHSRYPRPEFVKDKLKRIKEVFNL